MLYRFYPQIWQTWFNPNGLDSRQPLRIKVQMAARLPSLQTDLAVMCIMSEGLYVIQILHQLESEGLDPRLNQVKSDRLDFTRNIQMNLNMSFRWIWVMRWPDFYQMDLIQGHTLRRTWVCEPTLIENKQCTTLMPEDSSWCDYPQAIRRQWCQMPHSWCD